ncbi:MAG: tRNA (adenosine(37)-N6)-dimethylallyltransferase MiaA [Acidimicrobiia bacterium]|nr:tRNA (adenosine(37)-N6)-dimethylallyltransferase MiaA [Acidimicrobiia bacterium]
MDSPIRRAGQAKLADSLRGDVHAWPCGHHVQRAQGRVAQRPDGGGTLADRGLQQRRVRGARLIESDATPAPRVPIGQGLLHCHVLLQRAAAVGRYDGRRTAWARAAAGRVAGLPPVAAVVTPPDVAAILGPTTVGKSALAIAVAQRFNGEIVNCDSTAVYRGFDIGTDKVPLTEQGGIPHHLIDIVEPTNEYNAADFARDAARVIREIRGRGRLPLVVGGTGLYYRALTRGLFPGPGKQASLRARLERIAARHGGAPFLHRMLARTDPTSAARIQPKDLKRLVRALEVFWLTGRPLTAHFAATASPIADLRVLAIALRQPAEETLRRVTRRVDQQFERGLLDEMRTLLARGVPETARPFGGLVYRQALEHLHGVRDEAATRALIAQENRRYARRQLIWFRKEPNLRWFDGPGDLPATRVAVCQCLRDAGLIDAS